MANKTERDKARSREHQRELRADPEYRRRWNEYTRQKYANNAEFREMRKAYWRKSRQAQSRTRQAWWQKYRSTLRCGICGENHPAVLDFHHRDPNTKTKTVGALVSSGWAVSRILDEIEKCTVLCANCHRKLHWQKRNEQPDDQPGASREDSTTDP
jgi:hypothetical protein